MKAQREASTQRVVELFQKAQHAEQSGDYPGSVICYRQIVAIDPKIAEVWSNMGVALFRISRYAEAVGPLERAIALKPSLLAPNLFLGKAYLEMGEATKAVAPLTAALAIAPSQLDVLMALGDAYGLTHQYPSAIRLLQRATQENPDSEDAASRLAVIYFEWGTSVGVALRKSSSVYGRLLRSEGLAVEDPQAAEEEYRKTVASVPDSIEARLAFATFLMADQPSADKLQLARNQIETTRRIAPTNSDVICASIRLAIANRDFPAAAAELYSLAKLDPGFVLANIHELPDGLPEDLAAGIAKELQSSIPLNPGPVDSYSRAFSSLDELRSGAPLSGQVATRYAAAAWHLHRYNAAIAELSRQPHLTDEAEYWLYRNCTAAGRISLEKTVEAHPDSLRSHLLLANLALQQDQLGKARTEYQAAVSLRPDDPEVVFLYVRFLETARDSDEALDEASRGAAKFPNHALLNSEAGHLVLRMGGDPSIALRYLERSLSIDPKAVQPHVDLADTYASTQRTDDAIAELNKVIGADSDGSMHYRLARWYKQTGHPDQASEALEFCRKLKESRIKDEQRAPPARRASRNNSRSEPVSEIVR